MGNDLGNRIVLSMVSLYLILAPFYFWKSGIPQISDMVLLLALFVYLVTNRFKIAFPKGTYSFILLNIFFVFYILFVNAIWAFILSGRLSFGKVSAYYLYNSLICLLIVSLSSRYKVQLHKKIFNSTLVSVVFQAMVLLLFTSGTRYRAIAFFNNPNQLGYFGLLSAAIILYFTDLYKIKGSVLILGIVSSIYLTLSSLSSGAILAFAGMIVFFLFFHIKVKIPTRKMITFIFLLIITSYIINHFYGDTITSSRLYTNVHHRLSTMGQSSDDSLEGRYYNRITDYPQYWIFGGGEGAYCRFNSKHELHSTLGNLQFSYGIIGLSLFLAIIYMVCKRSKWRASYLIFFILFYGLTHNGIRNTLFWILMGLAIGEGRDSNE